MATSIAVGSVFDVVSFIDQIVPYAYSAPLRVSARYAHD